MDMNQSLDSNLLENELDKVSSVDIEANTMKDLEKLARIINASVNRGNAPENNSNEDIVKEDVIIEMIGEDKAANKTYYATYRQLNDEDRSCGLLPKLTSSMTSLQTKNPFCTLKPSTPWFKVSSSSRSTPSSVPPSPQMSNLSTSRQKEVSLMKVKPLNQYSDQRNGEATKSIKSNQKKKEMTSSIQQSPNQEISMTSATQQSPNQEISMTSATQQSPNQEISLTAATFQTPIVNRNSLNHTSVNGIISRKNEVQNTLKHTSNGSTSNDTSTPNNVKKNSASESIQYENQSQNKNLTENYLNRTSVNGKVLNDNSTQNKSKHNSIKGSTSNENSNQNISKLSFVNGSTSHENSTRNNSNPTSIDADDFDYIDECVEEDCESTYENIEESSKNENLRVSSPNKFKRRENAIYYTKTDRASGADFPYEQINSKIKEWRQPGGSLKKLPQTASGDHQTENGVVERLPTKNNEISNTLRHTAIFLDTRGCESLEEEMVEPRKALMDTKTACFACDACTQTETQGKIEGCHIM